VIKNNGNLTYAAEQVITLAKRNGALEILVGLPLDSVIKNCLTKFYFLLLNLF
jgi:hypothetical protein